MRYQLLGPIELLSGDDPVRLGGPKQQAVLALLLLNANRVVPEQRFVSMVWGDDAPASVRGQLQMYVSQLRKLIGAPVIIRRRPGYVIEVRPNELDLHVFDDRVRQARADLAAGRTGDAAEGLRSALALWRGPALGGVTQPLLDAEGPALADRRLAVLEEYFDASLAAGRHEEITREVREAAEENPLRERMQAQLMLVLHRSGRTTEALEVYTTTRSRLVAEKGVEPGPFLRDTQLRLLRDEEPATPLVPRQLPADVPVFAGRTAELARLEALRDTGVIVIGGGAGMGKTALAVHWANRVKERFPDGQLYTNLRGFDPGGNTVAPDDVVRGFLGALNLPANQIPVTADAVFSLYRSLLADKRVLVVLDNARDSEQVRPLLPTGPGSLTVVTSRNQLPSLVAGEGAVPVALGLLPAGEARDLLARRLGAARVDAEPDAVRDMIGLCARLPLALAIAAARAAANPAFSLAELAGDLTAGRLDDFDAGEPTANVRAVFSWSYLALDPPAARLFRLLGLHPGPHLTPATAASLLGEPVSRVRSLLAELTRAHLVTELSPGRYGYHDLLRAYATELVHAEDTEQDRRAAIHRMLDHYVHTTVLTERQMRPQLARFEPDVVPDGVTPADVRTEAEAVSWFAGEYETIAAAVELAVRAGFDTHAWRLAYALTSTFGYGGARWLGGQDVYETALDAARRLGDPKALGLAHRSRACFEVSRGRFDDAERDLVESLRLFEDVADLDGQADIHLLFGWLCGRRDDYPGAIPHAETAGRLFGATGNRVGLANSLNNLAWYVVKVGDDEQAVTLCEQALAILDEVGARNFESAVWNTLGDAKVRLGQRDEAIGCYQRSVDLYRKLGSKPNEAEIHVRIGDVHFARGVTGAARREWQLAATLFDELRLSAQADEVRDRLAGHSGTKALSKTGLP